MIRTKSIIVLIVLGGLMTSCNTIKRNATYFQDLERDTTLTGLMRTPPKPVIVPGDFLSINVAGLSEDFARVYNIPPDHMDGMAGYEVNQQGNIQFVRLGNFHVEGMTTSELRDTLAEKLKPYLGETIAITVGILNHHITMIGGINSGIVPLTQNMTLLDVLAGQGDIRQKKNIDKVLIVRVEGDKTSRSFKRVNIKDKSIFYSPYFYLQPNDIIYVEPDKEKTDGWRIATFTMSTLSFIMTLLIRFSRR